MKHYQIPFFGDSIKAGFPSPAADYQEKNLDFNELLVKHPASTYCLRVSGFSMANAGIFPDDLIIVDRSLSVRNKDIIIACIGGEFTVKRFIREKGECYLKAESEDYPDIFIENIDDFQIFGVVTSIIRQLKGIDRDSTCRL